MPEAKKLKPDFAILPSVNVLLDQLADQQDIIDPKYLKKIINQIITEIKNNPAHYKLERQSRSSISKIILSRAHDRVRQLRTPSPRHVINATGVILHTGLGRAPFDNKILNVANELTGYTNLEIRLDNGKRGERVDHVVSLLQLLTGAEGAVVVNNNAAAVLLMLNSIARRREVIVSRGELVEIGGSFRMPEVMISSGAKMVEVGATNKTHLEDYAQAITDKTAAILLVHPSNYQIIGFSAKPDPKEIIKSGS